VIRSGRAEPSRIGCRFAARALVAATLVAAGGTLAGAIGPRTADARDPGPARRVLIFSMPYVSWSDLDRASMPNLDRFLRRAAVAGLTTRVDQRQTPLADGYATIGAGTRTVGDPATDGGGLMADERFGVATAGDTYTLRTGIDPSGAIVQTGIVTITDANSRLHYDTEVGALARALARAGIGRAVVANADGSAPDAGRAPTDLTPGPARQRQAVLGLMDPRGQVAGGRVDPGLLAPNPDAPFGVQLDQSAVVDAFSAAWTGRAVVLVEASDLVRSVREAPYADRVTRAAHLRASLRRTDRLFGALLEQVDLRRDVVMVAGPAHAPGRVTLTPLAIRGPGFTPGLLRSATTRRSGFVQVWDLAPTVLAAMHVALPTSMEGRPAEVGATGGSSAQRIAFIKEADAAAQFRDERVGEVYGVLAGAAAVILGVGLLAMWWGRARWWPGVARFTALWGLGLLASAYLVRFVRLHEHGAVAYYLAFFGVGAALAGVCVVIGRRRPLDGLVAGLLAIVAILGLDALRGAPLVLNSVLGYSPTVAGRFAGFGNPAYAAFSAAALCGAVLLAHRVGGRRGLVVAGAVLGFALVIDVAPMWGSDIGGILSMVPAYGLTMVVLSGRRVRVRTVAIAVAAVVAVGTLAALVDFARPAKDRTHLGRLVERVRANGVGEFWSVVERKLGENLATIGSSILGLVLLVAAVGFVVMWRRDPERIRSVFRTIPEWRAACVGFVVLAVLGFGSNDSGIAIPGIMLVVFVAAWIHLLVTVVPVRGGSPAMPDAPPPDGGGGPALEPSGAGAAR
jgi:hypothetical protein